ncbi:MAG TPA: hypothetical protein PLP19_17075 [bacterium]|nr:hypothetical protein [bacterium]HPN45208.1 hypothetical protein [bacterium]
MKFKQIKNVGFLLCIALLVAALVTIALMNAAITQKNATILQLQNDYRKLLRIVCTPLYTLDNGKRMTIKKYKNKDRDLKLIETHLNDALQAVVDTNFAKLKARYDEGYKLGEEIGRFKYLTSRETWARQMRLINKANQVGDSINIPIYDLEAYKLKPFINDVLCLDSGLSKQEMLRSVLNQIYPPGRTTIRAVQQENGAAIVEIDLIDPTNKPRAWNQSFQGSTGGAITEGRLLMNILQPSLDIEWFDAVRFFQNNELINDFGHAELLHVTTTRNQITNYLNIWLK